MTSLPPRLALMLIAAAFWAVFYTIVPTANAGTLAFGTNSRGKTGMGTFSGYTDIATPIVTTNLVGRRIVQAAAGNYHNLLLADDGSVFSFGESDYGETGLGVTTGFASIATPIVTTNLGGRQIKQVATGHATSLLLADDGSVFSFGTNSFGRLGLGTIDGTISIATPIVTTNLGSRKITQVSAGGTHCLLLADDGSVFSMGSNHDGQTGLGTTIGDTTIATPIDTTNLGSRKIKQVAAGELFSLLLADDGSVFSFGNNGGKALGLGTSVLYTDVATPIDATNLGGRKITKIAAGYQHSLLLADDGTVFGFGENSSGQLGIGSFSILTVPVATPINTSALGGVKFTDVSAGWTHSMVLAEDHSVFSFGGNLSHQLGIGSTSPVNVPTPINMTNLSSQIVTQLDAGGFISLLLTEPALAGDFNHYGKVDAADYVAWRKTDGAPAGYDQWRANYGRAPSAGSSSAMPPAESLSAAVPESSAIALTLLVLIGVAFCRVRNSA